MLDMGFIKILGVSTMCMCGGCGLFPYTSHIVSGKVFLALGRSPVPLPLPAPPGAALLEVARLAVSSSVPSRQNSLIWRYKYH